jgi:hypothetical protein
VPAATCKWCGKRALSWRKTRAGRWQLHEPQGPREAWPAHECPRDPRHKPVRSRVAVGDELDAVRSGQWRPYAFEEAKNL